MNKLKVLIIAPSLNQKSGWGRYSISIIDALKEQEVDVNAVEVSPGISLSSVVNLMRIKKISRNFDVIHALDGWPFSIYAYFTVLGTSKRLFISGVGTYSVAPFSSILKGFLLRIAYKRAQRIFCISNYTNKSIKSEVSEAKTETIFMGLSKLSNLTRAEIDTYEDLYEIEGSPVILTVGEIKHRKGQLDTLKAVNLLKREYPDILYIMVGSKDKNYVSKIEQYAKQQGLEKNVRIISDALSDKSLSYFYSSCDIFALNSNNDGRHFEGFGLVLLEAAQFGKPVVGSKNCGIEDAIEDDFNGYYTEQGNPEDIARKIKKALNQKDVLGKNSLEFSKKFSWEKTVNKYIEFYK